MNISLRWKNVEQFTDSSLVMVSRYGGWDVSILDLFKNKEEANGRHQYVVEISRAIRRGEFNEGERKDFALRVSRPVPHGTREDAQALAERLLGYVIDELSPPAVEPEPLDWQEFEENLYIAIRDGWMYCLEKKPSSVLLTVKMDTPSRSDRRRLESVFVFPSAEAAKLEATELSRFLRGSR